MTIFLQNLAKPDVLLFLKPFSKELWLAIVGESVVVCEGGGRYLRLQVILLTCL